MPFDISPEIPRLGRLIEGSAHSPQGSEMAFRSGEMRVVVESKTITIFNPESEAAARALVDRLINSLNDDSREGVK